MDGFNGQMFWMPPKTDAEVEKKKVIAFGCYYLAKDITIRRERQVQVLLMIIIHNLS